MNTFGERLTTARKAKKLTQAELAETVGVKQGYLSELERGEKTNPAGPLVTKLEAALGLTLGTLSKLLAPGVETVPHPAGVRIVRIGTFELPLLGTVPAGGLGGQEYEAESFSFVDTLGKEGRFMLRVTGDSMAGVGIYEGDYVIVEPSRQADPGKVVVARVNGQTTVKILAKVGKGFQLVSANEKYPPITLNPADSTEIVGTVAAVLRTL